MKTDGLGTIGRIPTIRQTVKGGIKTSGNIRSTECELRVARVKLYGSWERCGTFGQVEPATARLVDNAAGCRAGRAKGVA